MHTAAYLLANAMHGFHSVSSAVKKSSVPACDLRIRGPMGFIYYARRIVVVDELEPQSQSKNEGAPIEKRQLLTRVQHKSDAEEF